MFEHEASLGLKHKTPLLRFSSLCHFGGAFKYLTKFLRSSRSRKKLELSAILGKCQENAVCIMQYENP